MSHEAIPYAAPVDTTALVYRCSRCGSNHSVAYRPTFFPHRIECVCGNTLVLDSPELRQLPEFPDDLAPF